jgi:hypothetical protein
MNKMVCEIDWERLGPRIDEIPDEIHDVVRLFDGKRNVAQVVRASSFPAEEARAIVEKLRREKLLVDARPAKKSDDAALTAWLAAGPRKRPLAWIAAGGAVALAGLALVIARLAIPSASASATVATAIPVAPVAAVQQKIEAPAVEQPKIETAPVEAPKAEAPAPVAVAAKAEAPAPAPVAVAPKADTPKAEAPVAVAPKAETKAEAPKAEAPKPAAPEAAQLVALARKQLDRGAVKKALGNATRAAELDPNQAEAYLIIGVAQQQNERTADARSAYQRYLALAPKGAYASEIRSVLRALR